MFGILRLLRQDERWGELDTALAGAFEKVKGDTKLIYSWIRYFREKDIQNDQRNDLLNREISEQKAIVKTLQVETAMLREEIRNVARNFERNYEKASPFPNQVRTKSGPESVSRFDRKIIAISRPVKKDYIMQQIMNLAEKGNYSTKQIESVIVKEKMLCGRTAFYDYLKEMKLRKELVLSEKGSRKVLVPRD